MESLEQLSQNVHLLLERYEALQQENARLKEESARQREDLIRAHSELQDIQQQYKRLSTANALTAMESKDVAYKRISALIAQVDRAIGALKR